MEAPPVPVKEPRGLPLFARLLLLILVCALPPLVGLGLKMMNTNADALEELVRHLHRSIVGDVQRAVRGELAHVEQDLEGLGQLLFAPGLGDDATRYALVGSRVAALGNIDFVTLYAPSGQSVTTVKASEVPAPELASRLEPALLESLRASGHMVTRDVRTGAQGGPVLEVYFPIVREGSVRAVLGTWLKLGSLCALMGELGERFLGSRDNVFVVDRRRRLVLHADPRPGDGARGPLPPRAVRGARRGRLLLDGHGRRLRLPPGRERHARLAGVPVRAGLGRGGAAAPGGGVRVPVGDASVHPHRARAGGAGGAGRGVARSAAAHPAHPGSRRRHAGPCPRGPSRAWASG